MARWEHLKFVLTQKRKFLKKRIWEHQVSQVDMGRLTRLNQKLKETEYTLNLMKNIEEKHDG